MRATVFLTYFENPGVWIAMRHLLHHTRQERIVPCKPETLLVEIVKHVVWEHVLQYSRLTSHGGRNVFANGPNELDIDILWVSNHHFQSEMIALSLMVTTTHLLINALMSSGVSSDHSLFRQGCCPLDTVESVWFIKSRRHG